MSEFDAQEQFEREYSAHTGMSLCDLVANRLRSGSYSTPKVSAAYHWWKRSRELLLAEMAVSS